MRRAAEERGLAVRRQRDRKTYLGRFGEPGAPGYYRKSRPLGCKKARCWLCHGDKLLGIPTMQERRLR